MAGNSPLVQDPRAVVVTDTDDKNNMEETFGLPKEWLTMPWEDFAAFMDGETHGNSNFKANNSGMPLSGQTRTPVSQHRSHSPERSSRHTSQNNAGKSSLSRQTASNVVDNVDIPLFEAYKGRKGCGPVMSPGTIATIGRGPLTVISKDGELYPAAHLATAILEMTVDTVAVSQPEQQLWSSSKFANCPEVLFADQPTQPWLNHWDERESRHLYQRPFHSLVDLWGRVMLSTQHKPIRYIPHFPTMFEPNVQGWYLEALFRTDPRFTNKDVLDRIPVVRESEMSSEKTIKSRRLRARAGLQLPEWLPSRASKYRIPK